MPVNNNSDLGLRKNESRNTEHDYQRRHRRNNKKIPR